MCETHFPVSASQPEVRLLLPHTCSLSPTPPLEQSKGGRNWSNSVPTLMGQLDRPRLA